MDNKQITTELRKLAKTCKHNEVADLQALAMHLRELEAFNAREVKLLVDAAKADVLEDLRSPGGAGALSLSHDGLASRLISETDATSDEAHWAVATWANALSGKAKEVTHAQLARPALKWDTDATGNAPNLSALSTSAPTPVSNNALPNPAALQATQQPAQPTPSSSRPSLSWDEDNAPKPSLSDVRASAPSPAPSNALPNYLSTPALKTTQPTASAAWPPPALSYSGTAGEDENTSGTDGIAPFPISDYRWNWGAFCLGWLWLVFNGRTLWGILLLLAQIVPGGALAAFVIAFFLGANGHRLAWRNRRFDSVEQFIAVQTAWARWGIAISICAIAVMAAAFVTGAIHGYEQGRAIAEYRATHPAP